MITGYYVVGSAGDDPVEEDTDAVFQKDIALTVSMGKAQARELVKEIMDQLARDDLVQLALEPGELLLFPDEGEG